MKLTTKYWMSLFLVLIMSLTLNTQIIYAQKPDQTIEVNMSIMDDFGNILVDYTKETFEIKDDHFVYRQPPVIDRYTFATANVLKLVNDNGETYRVNYFYTLDTTEVQDLPEPLPLSEMPMKNAPFETIKVSVSWTDESMRELTETKIHQLNYFWDAYEIPRPMELTGYGFMRLETGHKVVTGERIPQLVYVYQRRGEDEVAPSLKFAHLFGDKSISTIKAENKPPVATTPPQVDSSPNPGPIKDPGQSPGSTTATGSTGTKGTTQATQTTQTVPAKTTPSGTTVSGSTPTGTIPNGTSPPRTTPPKTTSNGTTSTGTSPKPNSGTTATTPKPTQSELNQAGQGNGLFIGLGLALLIIVVGGIYLKRANFK